MIPIRHTTPASDVTSPNCRKAPSRAVSRLPVAMTANPATTAPVSPSRRPAAGPAPSPVPPLDTEGSQKSETCRPGEPGYAREATFREPRRAPAASSAGPAAVLRLTALRRGAVAGLDSIPAAAGVLRPPRAARRTGSPARRAAGPRPPPRPLSGVCPAFGPISSSVPPARTGRCRQRHGRRGKPGNQ